ncbi:MAG: tetratricopeptide repeat protein, partial [Candidatus Poribacteria bacterium]|nr:tetratricopeptide repeat protein [Candidatus Poribacteria bacterium]
MVFQKALSPRTVAVVLMTVVLVFPAVAGEREEYTFAFSLFQDGKYIFAKDQFKAYLENYPNAENADDARFLLGECALRLEDYDDAIYHYKKLTENPASPLRLDAVRGVATAWFHQGKYEEAIKAYEEVIEGSKDAQALSRSLYLVGESYDNLGLYQKAVEYYNRVLEQFPISAEAEDALYGKAWGLFRIEDYGAAHSAFAEFVKTSPNHPAIAEASYRGAESLFKSRDWARAQVAYQNVIDTYRDDDELREFVINARYRLGECYFQQRMMEKAKSTFNLLLHESAASSVA